MVANNIFWDEGKVPTIARMKKCARKLLKECKDEPEFGQRRSVGRFTAYVINNHYTLEYSIISSSFYDTYSNKQDIT